MGEDSKEFNSLLLNNLSNLTDKIDKIHEDVGDLKGKVAVLMETKETVRQLDCCLEKFQDKMSSLDKDLAIKSSIWAVISSIVTFLIALFIAYLSGVFSAPYEDSYPPFRTRSGTIQTDTTHNFDNYGH